ncbi:MAG TPA: hypothetical protein VHZ09_04735 [Acidobacteriaceae bacterium]|nr:hypothetical protein [Acidobacteriaceae bacterium]
MRVCFVMGFLVLGCAVAGAQIPAQPPSADGSIRTRIQGIEVPPIPGAPFTAKVVVEWDQPLIGGGTVSRTYYTMVARDAQGRVHREIRGFVLAGSNEEPPLRTITILDPVADTRTNCVEATMQCTVTAYQPRTMLTGAAVAGGHVTTESLGSQTMQGLTAVGTRETQTTQTSSRVILSHTESWYSPQLQMDLSVARSNPQMGQVTLTVENLQQVKPDGSWFALPAGFQVSDGRPQ